MSLVKTVDGMSYEAAGTKKASKGSAERVAVRVASELSTGSILWLLVKRHKFALAVIGDAILVLNWIFPEWVQLVKSLI